MIGRLPIGIVLVALAAVAAGQEALPTGVDAGALGRPYYSGAILPTPRQAEYGDDSVDLADGPGGAWGCRIAVEYDGPARDLLIRLLSQRLGQYTGQFPELAGIPFDSAAPDALPVVFALVDDRRARPFLRRYGLRKAARALEPEGYLLEIRPDGVFCGGRDNAGLVNGLASFLQLVHVRDGRLAARCASVRDWPTFLIRYTSEYHLPGEDFFDWMMLNKINGFGACYPGMRWEGLSDDKRAGLEAIGRYIRAYETMHFMVQFHIGGRGGRAVDCGNPDDVGRLLDTIAETMRLCPTQHVMVCYDDVTPELQPQERGKFERPAQAHGWVMERVYEAVKAIDSDTVVSFCSPHYQGRDHRRWRESNPRLPETLEYMEDLHAWPNADIRIVWTGPVTESRSIDLRDIEHYRGLIGENKQLVYWDNTWHYHQPLRNFHAQYLDGFVEYCADRTSYINVNGVGPIGRFFAVTANDYYWNPEGLDAGRTRRLAVAQFMGPRAVPAAEAFYALRGNDYNVFFTRDVDLDALKSVLSELERTSIDPELPQYCWDVYEGIVKKRAEAQAKPQQ
ncbi:MAG: beta-N-acetylglucosaminidase domain-containing protein [Candidatus Hydrogenedentes bacterium]|nr:beta-N-acetylglucosaminidase domain-containing protein [Candidatus Hydrogenedentota bacterium]